MSRGTTDSAPCGGLTSLDRSLFSARLALARAIFGPPTKYSHQRSASGRPGTGADRTFFGPLAANASPNSTIAPEARACQRIASRSIEKAGDGGATPTERMINRNHRFGGNICPFFLGFPRPSPFPAHQK